MTTELVLLGVVAAVVALLIVIGVRINRARRAIEASTRQLLKTLGRTEDPATRHVFKANAFEFGVQAVAAVAAGAAGLVSMTLTASLPQLVTLAVMAVTVYVVANGLFLLLDQAVGGIRERLHRAAGCECQHPVADEVTTP